MANTKTDLIDANGKRINRTRAIHQAQSNVGQIYRFGKNWKFNRWDEKLEAWRESIPKPYAETVADRSQVLLDEACRYLGVDRVVYGGGKWEQYVPAK